MVLCVAPSNLLQSHASTASTVSLLFVCQSLKLCSTARIDPLSQSLVWLIASTPFQLTSQAARMS